MNAIIIRPAVDSDVPFFYSALLQSHFYSAHAARCIPADIYYSEHKRVLQSRFRNGAHLLVACLKEDPQVILGFMFYEQHIIHYIYVKKDFRKFGIARRLLEFSEYPAPYVVTHWTSDLTEVCIKYPNRFIYNPYLLMG